MLINLNLLKKFINVNIDTEYLKQLLASIGIEVAGISDYKGTKVFEVEITPNRPDWLSHYGIAREIYSKERSLSFNEIKVIKPEPKSSGNIEIRVEDAKDCERYSAALIRNIEVKESSDEVKELLESLGMRPVNNIVDISNLILMTYGHPTHIFDYGKLNGNTIKIRRGKSGEKIKLLDGRNVMIGSEDLVIADMDSPIALAGVMGGEDSGVTFDTKDIVVESAYFNPTLVRRTSKRYGMKTDSSYLFERGADIGITDTVLSILFDMLKKDQSKTFNITDIFDFYPDKSKKQTVSMDKYFPSAFTGIDLGFDLYREILNNLGFSVVENGGSVDVSVPSFRVDINGKEDLVEEIIRIYGYDKLNSEIPKTVNPRVFDSRSRDLKKSMRMFLEAKGFNEVINYSFQSEKDNLHFGKNSEFVEIKNPIGKEFSIMRNSMLPGLLKNISLNRNNDFKSVTLFEFGTVFKKKGNELIENNLLSISVSGEYSRSNWRKKEPEIFDFFIFKSIIFSLFDKMRLDISLSFTDSFNSFLNAGSGFELVTNGKILGYIGKVNKTLLDMYKIDEDVYTAQLDMDIIFSLIKDEKFKMWNKFPYSTRDLSFIIDKNISYNNIEQFIKKEKIENLEHFDIVDIYEGEKIQKGKKSILMSFKYRSRQKTLTGEEVNELHNKLVNSLMSGLGINLR